MSQTPLRVMAFILCSLRGLGRERALFNLVLQAKKEYLISSKIMQTSISAGPSIRVTLNKQMGAFGRSLGWFAVCS